MHNISKIYYIITITSTHYAKPNRFNARCSSHELGT